MLVYQCTVLRFVEIGALGWAGVEGLLTDQERAGGTVLGCLVRDKFIHSALGNNRSSGGMLVPIDMRARFALVHFTSFVRAPGHFVA